MFPTPFIISSQQRQTRSFTQDEIPFLHNLIFQHTLPVPFETEAHSLHTIPILREIAGSYLCYF